MHSISISFPLSKSVIKEYLFLADLILIPAMHISDDDEDVFDFGHG